MDYKIVFKHGYLNMLDEEDVCVVMSNGDIYCFILVTLSCIQLALEYGMDYYSAIHLLIIKDFEKQTIKEGIDNYILNNAFSEKHFIGKLGVDQFLDVSYVKLDDMGDDMKDWDNLMKNYDQTKK